MKRTILMGGTAVAVLLFASGAIAQDAPPTVSEAIAGGKLILEARARYESVDQAGLVQQGEAPTLRTRIGWETAEWRGIKGLVELEDVRHLGAERYNVAIPGPGGASLNGLTTFPIVNDPKATELNRLQFSWAPNAGFSTVVGRQRILIDDQRFIGNVGWRQDEQTFDAARIDLAYGRVKATYAYVDQVNRIFGEARDWESDSHLFSATYSPAEALKLQAFVYDLDFENSAANSTITRGLRASGKAWLGLFQLAYSAAAAEQEDNADNPASFTLSYLQTDAAATYDIWTVKLSYEQLEGDGTRGFTTPLATTHAFNGWSDAFAIAGGNKTHVDGLEDLNLQLTVQPRFKFTYWSNTQLILRYHEFKAERTGADLAQEFDAQVQAAITPKLTFLVKYADFDREETVPVGTTLAPVDRRKGWISLEYKL